MSDQLQNAVAIIGMSGRFPGADTIEQFWQNLCAGRESIQTIPASELDDGLTAEERANGKYVAARALLENVDQFDAEFFHFLPREAELTDPQQRILIECAWEAFEDAGYDPGRISGNVGVFAGASINTYLLLNLASDAKFREEFTRSYQVGSFPALVGNGHDFLATRISYKLNLRGPAMTVQSACSTSLLAVAQAWQSLVNYQSDLALAGAASVSFPQRRGYFHQEGGMVSPDGHCRPFDKSAAGTVFGAGAGMVLLKRAEEAIADGDHIYALILGAGVNNDGSGKIGYAAPSIQGQAGAITTAHAVAGVDANSIGYVECHGTGTPLGDPIEVSALAQAFSAEDARRIPCVLGSVKGNVGHLDVAAGMAGLMKAALSLDRELIPGTLHYTEPNPRLELPQTPFTITAEPSPWPRGAAGDSGRRAGVSAFGVGGTNVHLVLQEAPLRVSAPVVRSSEPFCLSARSARALELQCERLAHSLELASEALPLADVARTLATGRRAFSQRLAFAAATRQDAITQLRKSDRMRASRTVSGAVQLAMLFPGQGSQYPGMGKDLYRTEPVYRQAVEDCCERLQRQCGLNLLDVLYPSTTDEFPEASATARVQLLQQTRYAQPALFVTSYAIARLWMHWGVHPEYLCGHSVGEIVAACVAGVFSLDNALEFVARRGEWMQALPPGAMLAVRMQLQPLRAMLPQGIDIAAINAPGLTVVSGPQARIEEFAALLDAQKVVSRRLRTSHAFHSAMVEPVALSLRGLVSKFALHPPQIKIISTVTGETLRPEDATSAEYWSNHCRVPVNFSAAVTAMVREGCTVFLEAGAGDTLTTLVRQHLDRGADAPALPSLPSMDAANAGKQDWDVLSATSAALWARGVDVNWEAFFADRHTCRVSLPTYPFDRKRYWIDARGTAASKSPESPVVPQPHATSPNKTIAAPAPTALENTMNPLPDSDASTTAGLNARIPCLEREIAAMLEDLSGLEIQPEQFAMTFLELGFDSLLLTQVAQKLQTTYGVKIAFRQLLDGLESVSQLTTYLDREMPQEAPPPPAQAIASGTPSVNGSSAPHSADAPAAPATVALMQQQLQAMMQLIQTQLQTLHAESISPAQPAFKPANPVAPAAERAPSSAPSQEQNALHRQPVAHSSFGLTQQQEEYIRELAARYSRKTAKSKVFTQEHRKTLADPRVVSGFRPEWKEMVYSIVSSRSRGSKLWDIDGNEYIDLLNGFGPTMFGHSPDFVIEAIQEQMKEGFAIGPQTPLAGKAAALLTEMTGTERVTFCNTGSEAVMAAMRIARTVTGRDRVVFFAGDYHGQFDEVLAKQLRRKGEYTVQPAAPGIPRPNLGSITVLDYGTEESLRYIEQNANNLAAVLIEPVQSRHPNLQPKEFLSRLREITRQSGTAFIFDEVVTGFRIHPRGAQGFYGIDADMVTYGKVVAGGMPIGILAGKSAFMDALDGGMWQFGDASVPEVGVTFFAGTFVRHPLTMAALCATLQHIREAGIEVYDRLNTRAAEFAARWNQVLTASGLPLHLENCGSVMFLRMPPELRFAGLLYYLMREKGVFLLEGFPMYLTTAHTDADLDHILRALRESIAELQSQALLPGQTSVHDGVDVPSENAMETVSEIPLTEPQMEVLLAAQVSDAANCAFNESFRVSLNGPLDVSALNAAWRQLLGRHDALRMALTPAGDKLRRIQTDTIPIAAVDITAMTADRQLQQLESWIEQEGSTPFDLVQGPLVRAQLVRLAGEKHVLIVTAHHLICDGWSVNVLLNELAELYSAIVRGGSATLPGALQFSSYARNVSGGASGRVLADDLEYWKRRLTPLPELLTLPADRPRPATRSYAGSTYFTEFPAEMTVALRKVGAGVGCTLFTTLLAGWQVLLWRLSGNCDPVTMIPAAAQAQIDDQVLVGHCVHLLPIRAALQPEMTVAEWIRTLKPVVLEAYDHQHATYGSIVHALAPRREQGRLPLSEVQFNLERLGRGVEFHGLQAEARANGKRAVNFDLFLNIVDTGNGLRLECDYSTTLYDESTVARWLAGYRTLLESMISNTATPLAALPVVGSEEREYLEARNATATGPMPVANVPELISRSFASFPGKPAADFYGMEISRAELSVQTDRLAAWLLRNNAGPGSLVGIYMDRSLEMLIAVLGVLKAGAAYVPLDPSFPAARIDQILEDTLPAVMITLRSQMEQLHTSARVIALDSHAELLAREPVVPLPAISPEDRAYVIFTSGSTGRPKGVEVTHGSVVNLLVDLAARLDMRPADRWLAVTTLAFDISVLELLLPLVTGGTVAIAHRDDLMDGARLLDLLRATRATVLQATPVTWKMLLEQGFQPDAGFKMLCGGEAWTSALANQLLRGDVQPAARLWNMYGPTETTVWSAATEVMRGADRVTIGVPMANTRFYVLDSHLQPVPMGVRGELFVAGRGVARGYFNRPQLTAEKFLPDPFIAGERMYRTGDEVRQLPDGSMEFLGRVDHQVKLRGFRIELGEIESAMRQVPGLREAVAVLRQDLHGESVLVGFYTGADDLSSLEIKEVLQSLLPGYMVPTILRPIDAFPLTPNGKLDRNALPQDATPAADAEEDWTAPRTAIETSLAQIVCEVLGVDRVSVRKNLLDMGADSLRMFQIASRAHRRGIRVTVRQMMQLHSIEAVAAALEAAAPGGGTVPNAAVPLQKVSRESYRLTT